MLPIKIAPIWPLEQFSCGRVMLDPSVEENFSRDQLNYRNFEKSPRMLKELIIYHNQRVLRLITILNPREQVENSLEVRSNRPLFTKCRS
jgi:hypothetical protein